MPEIVIPGVVTDSIPLDRMSLVRGLVGRRGYRFEGALAQAQDVVSALSEDSSVLLLNDTIDATEDKQVLDVSIYQSDQQRAVSKGVEKPLD